MGMVWFFNNVFVARIVIPFPNPKHLDFRLNIGKITASLSSYLLVLWYIKKLMVISSIFVFRIGKTEKKSQDQ
jgi:hypothetical protein